MAKPAPIELEVIHSTYITPHMLRITLGGDALQGFPAEQEGAYVKLLFPRDGEARSLMRTYTIRYQRELEIDIDFAIHENTGPASSWALGAKVGDRILVAGPGAKKLINPHADWFLLAGDMTALPAISVNLEMLPQSARGYAVLEIIDESDIQPLVHPANIDVHWIVNPQPDPNGETILEHIWTLDWLDGQPSAWAACEFSSMQQLRKYFRQERVLDNRHRYVSSYWKIGHSEDQHKLVKRQDAERDTA